MICSARVIEAAASNERSASTSVETRPGTSAASAAPTETASRSATAATRASALAALPRAPGDRLVHRVGELGRPERLQHDARDWSCSRRASAVAPPRCRRYRRPRSSSRAADRVWTPSGCFFRLASGGEWQVHKRLHPASESGQFAACSDSPDRALAIPMPSAKMTRPTKIGGRVADEEDHQRRRRRPSTRCSTGILAAHPRHLDARAGQPAGDRRARRPAARQGRAGHRRRLGPRADLPRLRRRAASPTPRRSATSSPRRRPIRSSPARRRSAAAPACSTCTATMPAT